MKTPVDNRLEAAQMKLSFRPPRVFIVDDEISVLELLEGYLETEGYLVSVFSNAFDGARAIARHQPEVALVDLKMPGLHGLELVAEGQKNSPATSFVVITGYTTVDTLLEAIRHGVDDYLTKPFSSSDTVRLVVGNAVKKNRLERQLLMHTTISSTILQLGELSCVGEEREEFFRIVREAFFALLNCTTVASLYEDRSGLLCFGETNVPLAPPAADQLLHFALDEMGLNPRERDVDFRIRPQHPDTTTPFVMEFGTLIPIPIKSQTGIEVQLVLGHTLKAACSEEAIRMSLALADNVSSIVQSQIRGAGHEHQMIVDMLHHHKDGVLVLDRGYKVRYVNPQARRILDISDTAPLQDALDGILAIDSSLVSPGRQRNFMAALQKQVTVRRKDDEFFFDVEAYAFYTPAKVAYRVILFHDVTRLRRENRRIDSLNKRLNSLNEELRERNRHQEALIKELDSFAYMASHDLQEPFRHIQIFADYLSRDLSERMTIPDDIQYHLEQIDSNVTIATTLLADLRALSKITRTRNPYRWVPLDELVESVLERFQSSIEETDAEIIVKEMPDGYCDPIKLKEVLHNLIGNALKYTKNTPVIEVSGLASEDHVLVTVQDNGIGVDPEYHDYIFQACRRIPHGDDTMGSGLGLAIVKKIIDEHGGKVWVESALTEGARFCFILPNDT
jgi:signal transduction histidine kinase/FixJ family two-component response regulator